MKRFQKFLVESESPYSLEPGQGPGTFEGDPNYRHIGGVQGASSIADAHSQGLASARILNSIEVDNTSMNSQTWLSQQPKNSFWHTTMGRQMLMANGNIWRAFVYDNNWNNSTYLRNAFSGIVYLTGNLANMQRQIANHYAQTVFNNLGQYPGTAMPGWIFNRISGYV